jgi:filamentous hemagglutinin family protein
MIARWSLLLTRLSLVLGSPAALAQIVTDGTVGPATRLSGPEMTIGAELGSTRGGNLFHSFQRFDIPTGQRATFTGPDQIQNVIGRVTGGQTSHIDGTLRSTVGQADVYLINPSGVVMGPNAKVDVPAAFHVSTADEVRFSDGSRYSATDPAASRLTLAAPESFGFLSPQPASLRIEGSQLELKPGKTATLTAGDVSIAGTAERRATLKAPGGEIRLEAVGDRGGQVSVTMPTEQPGSGRLSLIRRGSRPAAMAEDG